MQIAVSGYPSKCMRPDTQVHHVHEGLHVDFASTEMHHNDLEMCCLVIGVLSIDSQ
jgi:hypothetical protein